MLSVKCKLGYGLPKTRRVQISLILVSVGLGLALLSIVIFGNFGFHFSINGYHLVVLGLENYLTLFLLIFVLIQLFTFLQKNLFVEKFHKLTSVCFPLTYFFFIGKEIIYIKTLRFFSRMNNYWLTIYMSKKI